MIVVILPSFLGVEGQTCKVHHEDQAMAPASDEDIFVSNFKCTLFQNRTDLLFFRRSSMTTSQLSAEERNKMTMVITSSLGQEGQTFSSLEDHP